MTATPQGQPDPGRVRHAVAVAALRPDRVQLASRDPMRACRAFAHQTPGRDPRRSSSHDQDRLNFRTAPRAAEGAHPRSLGRDLFDSKAFTAASHHPFESATLPCAEKIRSSSGPRRSPKPRWPRRSAAVVPWSGPVSRSPGSVASGGLGWGAAGQGTSHDRPAGQRPRHLATSHARPDRMPCAAPRLRSWVNWKYDLGSRCARRRGRSNLPWQTRSGWAGTAARAGPSSAAYACVLLRRQTLVMARATL